MFIINDIELLMRLGKHRILDYMLSQCKIGISAVRLSDYSMVVRREIDRYGDVNIEHVDEGFHVWHQQKRKYLSLSDLTSVYLAKNPQRTLVISSEDLYVTVVARLDNINCIQFDDFMIATIKDERLIQLYNLIKVG